MIMKKQHLLISSIILINFYCDFLIAQTTTFDNLNANPFSNKAITWTSSNWGSGFGHRIINSDPGGQTLLNFQGRHNTTNWSTIMALTSNGKVGIGTINPQQRLHVTGGVQFKYTSIGATTRSAENSWIRDDWLTGCYGPPKWNQATAKWVRPGGTYNDVGGIIYQDEGTYFIRDKRGTQLEYTNNEFLGKAFMFAHISSGNVGIGTNTPDSKLTVAGKIHSQEVKVTIDAGADFVFENSYNLPTLEDVEQFIIKNKHLPEIASAKEMEKNGIHLAEMNIKLLQKIEELTLYTIEQQKKIEELSSLASGYDYENRAKHPNAEFTVYAPLLTKAAYNAAFKNKVIPNTNPIQPWPLLKKEPKTKYIKY